MHYYAAITLHLSCQCIEHADRYQAWSGGARHAFADSSSTRPPLRYSGQASSGVLVSTCCSGAGSSNMWYRGRMWCRGRFAGGRKGASGTSLLSNIRWYHADLRCTAPHARHSNVWSSEHSATQCQLTAAIAAAARRPPPRAASLPAHSCPTAWPGSRDRCRGFSQAG